MKIVALSLGALLILGPAALAVAQSSQTPAGSSTPGDAPSGPSASQPSDRKPETSVKPDENVNIEKKDGAEARGDRDDGGAALPRSVSDERTRIFGLSPTAAVVVGAALLVVVVLAIVAMTRSGEPTFIDRDRRM